DAMKNRRTYASLDKSLQARYTVNGAVMGSTLDKPSKLHFEIALTSSDKITKIDVVKDGGVVAADFTPTPDSSAKWAVTIDDSSSKYFFVRVWTARGGDAPGANPANPAAWLAPVWTGR